MPVAGAAFGWQLETVTAVRLPWMSYSRGRTHQPRGIHASSSMTVQLVSPHALLLSLCVLKDVSKAGHTVASFFIPLELSFGCTDCKRCSEEMIPYLWFSLWE